MRSVCFFASYFEGNQIPHYVTVYLKELKKHFGELFFLTQAKDFDAQDLQFLEENKIVYEALENKGFDFGLWYQAFQKYDVSLYSQVALVNDSCVLFKPLDEFMSWSQSNKADVQGMTLSEAVAPHIQSYFLIFSQRAIAPMLDYFNRHKVYTSMSEVIRHYEVGLSTELASKGLTHAAFIDNNGYKGEFSPYFHCVKYHLSKGIPLIKKKILLMSYRQDELFTLARMGFKLSPAYYVKIVKRYNGNLLIDLDKLIRENEPGMSSVDIFRYNCIRVLILIGRPIYRLFRRTNN